MSKRNDTKALLAILKGSLEHIKDVQKSVLKLNHDSMTLLCDNIFEAELELCEDGFVALQHQDILSQQLNATIELIEMIDKYSNESCHRSLRRNISSSLKVAKLKKEAFSGNAFEQKY